MRIVDNDIDSILRDNWGHDSFRPSQREIVTSVLSGRDTIGLLPTGGGKSITFQVPALALDGLTVVVSPLISLMKDQVDNLRERGIKAVYIHSALTRREASIAIERCRLGKARLLYLSPEKLSAPSFVDTLRTLPVSLITVDEAHCISQWGYDFRPSYLNIAGLRKLFPDVPVLALTASATPEVVDDIAARLEMRNPAVFRRSFTRDNLSYVVRYTDHKEGKLVEVLSRVGGSAIVYVRSRRRTRDIAQRLVDEGINAEFYHAGLDAKEKDERQNRWKSGETRVMVATNAFGMGIDKPDVRVVVHMDLPPSLEEYYQEAGRAGRDGNPSIAVVIASRYDKATLSRRLTESYPDKEYIRRIYTLACAFLDIPVGGGYNTINEFNLQLFCHRHSLNPVSAVSALKILSQAGMMEFEEEITTRSRVMILVTKEELYHIQLSGDSEIVLRQLLRDYTGLFADYAYISEPLMAQRLGLTEERIYEALLLLTRMHVLHYVPRKTSPYIFLPTSRENERDVVIPQHVYELRRKRMAVRLDAMRKFVFDTTQCRVTTLLQYFGEAPTGNCGQCDVCRSQHKSPSGSAPDYRSRVAYMLRDKRSVNQADIAGALGISMEKCGELLRDMADDGAIAIDGDSGCVTQA